MTSFPNCSPGDETRSLSSGSWFLARREYPDRKACDGAHNTHFWIDPKEQMIGIMMIQLKPYAHLNIRQEFQNAVTQAIVD
jgi:CubicO group peptidase (beta-lactamase class C family)